MARPQILKDRVQLNIWIERDALDQLRAIAETNYRTLGGELRMLIDRHLATAAAAAPNGHPPEE